MSDTQVWRFVVAEEDARIDRYLAGVQDQLSRSAIQRLIESGLVTRNGAQVTKGSQSVAVGDRLEVRVPPAEPSVPQPEALPLEILYEDDDILALNKAAGMVVHPGAGNRTGTLVNALLAHCPELNTRVGEPQRPGIVHRLDKDTSGVMVVAKHNHALTALQRQFKRREVEKTYLALVIGRLASPAGLIEAPIARHPVQRQRMAVVAQGKAARTRWELTAHYQDANGRDYALVRVQLLTGRTHQIRVHFAWLGYPLVGDATYGPRHPPLDAPRQFLHAEALTLTHPETGARQTFTAPLPEDLAGVLRTLRIF